MEVFVHRGSLCRNSEEGGVWGLCIVGVKGYCIKHIGYICVCDRCSGY